MMKLFGTLIILACGILSGITVLENHKNKIKFLKEYIEFILFIKSEIKYSQKTIYEISKNASSGKLFLPYIKNFIKFSTIQSLPDDWAHTYDNIKENLRISPEEKALIIKFGENLGITDVLSQINYCDHHVKCITSHLIKEQDKQKQLGNLPLILSIGISAVIILIII